MENEAQDYEDEYEEDEHTGNAAHEEPLKTERLEESVRGDASERRADAHDDLRDRTRDGEIDNEGAGDAGCDACGRNKFPITSENDAAVKGCAADSQAEAREGPVADPVAEETSATVQESEHRAASATASVLQERNHRSGLTAGLENKNKEKQLQPDQLLHENRMLAHQQRLLQKQIEELQDAKKYELQEELRVCKERIRHYKEKQKEMDEKSFKLRQQTVDFGSKNKMLIEKIKHLEQNTAPLSPSASFASTSCLPQSFAANGTLPSQDVEAIIASQEDEITRLQQHVALMKKTQRSDKSKYEKQIKASQDELEQSRAQLEALYQQLFVKEKTIRSLFLQMKKLKRAVQDLMNAQQTNHHMQQMIFGRELRFSHHSPNHHTQRQQHGGSSSSNGHHLHPSSSTQNLPVTRPKRAAVERIHDTLKQLGYVPTFKTTGNPGKLEKYGDHADGGTTGKHGGANHGAGRIENDRQGEEDDDGEELPPNCIQGRLIPCPTPSSADRKALRGGARPQLHAPPSSRKSGPVSAEDAVFDVELSPSRSTAHGSEEEKTFDDGTVSDEFGIPAFESDGDDAQ
ncbi:hypothetical protein FI667_g7886, partial [Globisporangium splendens]